MAPSHTGQLPSPPEEATTTPACTLPYDLVLEIVARSNVVTVVRSAATCKPLRRDILSPAFIRRVCQQHGGVVPPFLVGYLRVPNTTVPRMASSSCFSLVHPETPAATSLSEDHLARFLSRRAAAADFERGYAHVTSRNGLVVLRRWPSDICVYDPMTGNRAYLPCPDVEKFCLDRLLVCTYVLLTAADSVGCSFLLVATDSKVSRIQTVSSAAAAADGTSEWAPVISVDEPDRFPPSEINFQVQNLPHYCGVVLNGLIHWLMHGGDPDFHIRTYDVPRHGKRAATTTGSIEVSKACLC